MKINIFISAAFLFLFCAVLFIPFHIRNGFPDPDSFYHLKMAQLIREQGLITDFPWLPFTTIGDHFTNHHLLYHIFISFWLFVFPSVLALKAATVVIGAIAVSAFYAFLRKFHISFALLYTLFLLANADFLFRLNLAKGVGLALIFLFLFLYALFREDIKWVFLVSFLYVWLYAGFIILIPCAIIYLFSSYLSAFIQKRSLKKEHKNAVLVCLFVFLGIALGVIIHPYFPSNVFFYYQQIFEIAFINRGDIILVGMEWNPYPPMSFFLTQVMICFFYLCAQVIFILRMKEMGKKEWFLCMITFCFFVLTLKSQRYVEYFVPLSLVFSAFIIQKVLHVHTYAQIFSSFRLWYKEIASKFLKAFIMVICVYALASFVFFFGKNWYVVHSAYRQVFSQEKFQQASAWLKENSQKGDIVFHTSFDEFPLLFYHNDHNVYITGLDPTFFYNKDKRIYMIWNAIILGKTQENLYNVVRDEFNASFILINHDWPSANPYLANDPLVSLVYTDAYANIYQLNSP